METTALSTNVSNNNLSIFESAEKWQLATKMATSLAQSTIVPKDFQGNANNTLIAIELATRLQTSPIMVMQNLYVVHGRPSWSAQYIIAMINGSGRYDMELQFDEKTDKNGKPYSCTCWTEKNGRKITGPEITMDLAKVEGWFDKNGSKWKTMPQMMLRYRAASFFGRMNCPDLMMGMYTREEQYEIGNDEYVAETQGAIINPFEQKAIEQKSEGQERMSNPFDKEIEQSGKKEETVSNGTKKGKKSEVTEAEQMTIEGTEKA